MSYPYYPLQPNRQPVKRPYSAIRNDIYPYIPGPVPAQPTLQTKNDEGDESSSSSSSEGSSEESTSPMTGKPPHPHHQRINPRGPFYPNGIPPSSAEIARQRKESKMNRDQKRLLHAQKKGYQPVLKPNELNSLIAPLEIPKKCNQWVPGKTPRVTGMAITALFEFGHGYPHKLNLHDLGRHLKNCKFDPASFVSAMVQLHSPQAHVSIFTTGKMTMVGIKSPISAMIAFRKVAWQIKNLTKRKLKKMREKLEREARIEKWNDMDDDERHEADGRGWPWNGKYVHVDSLELDADEMADINERIECEQKKPEWIDYSKKIVGLGPLQIGSVSGSAHMSRKIRVDEFAEKYPDNVQFDEEMNEGGYAVYRRSDQLKGECRIYPNGAINILGIQSIPFLELLFQDVHEKLVPFLRRGSIE